MHEIKLYVKSICFVCNNKLYHCSACTYGYTYVEAADKAIYAWLKEQSPETKAFIASALDLTEK